MHMHKHQHLHRRQGGLSNFINDATSSFQDDVQDLTNDHNDNNSHHHKESGSDGNNGNDSQDEGKRSPDASPDAATLVSVVFITATPTFTGAIAGYSTLGPAIVQPSSPEDTPTQAPTKSPQTTSKAPKVNSKTSPATAASSTAPAAAVTISVQPETTSEALSQTSLITSIRVTPSSPSLAAATSVGPLSIDASSTDASAAAATADPSATSGATQVSQKDTGLSGGAKAGIAIGVILGLLALVAATFALYRYKKNRAEENYIKENNEKTNPFADAAAAAAPLHTRPITPPQQAPTAMASGAGIVAAGQGGMEKSQATNPANPFGQHAETVQAAPVAPSGNAELATLAAGAGAGAVATAAVAKRSNGPKPLDLNRSHSPSLAVPAAMPSPSPSQFSNSSMTSAAIAGGAPATNVHRVQLDFKPSMDDELELRAGQLVRLLHEYDDGWALCIRLDRSQQGVVPRTCLSTRPVKPRNGPPKGVPPPGPRVMQGSPVPVARTASPSSSMEPQRSASPALNPRPVQRSMSPGPYGGGPQQQLAPPALGRLRSNSADDVHEKRVAPGPSPMNPGMKVANQSSPNFQMAPIQIPAAAQENSVPASPVTRKPVPRQST